VRDKAAREGSAGAAGTSGSGTVLVVGAGIAGMQAALDLADGGYAVHLVTTDPSVGGRMSQLDKTFPTNDCAMCLLGPRMTDTGRHPNITLHTCSTLVGLEGEPGAFLAHIRKAPRYVDVEDCTACGECAEVCPVELPDRFNVGMTGRKAIHKYFPQAVPNAYLISKAGTPPCRNTCPAQCNVQGYTALIAQGRFAEALEVARRRIPFPGICGRICHHPCESKCNRADIDEPVAIHTLKRAAFDFGREDLAKASEAAEAASGAAGGAAGAHPGPADITRKEKVAVVGAGPAGLTAALDLVEQGFEVTVYDQQAKPGGMLRYGIPRYRLPVEIVDEETDWVLRRGVKFVGSTRVGEDVTIDGLLRDGFAAVIVATGVQKGRSLPLEGMDAEGVYLGMEFLKAAAKLGTDEEEAGRAELPDLEGKRVLVVGGGNVAVDTARTALRLGAREVHMACLESRTEMPAHEWEVEEALEEGVVLHPSWGPKRVLTRDEPAGRDGDADSGRAGGGGGRRPVARGLEMLVCTRVFDDEGRFSPELAPGTERVFEADVIILSVGQAVDRGFERGSGGDALAGLELTPGGYVVADRLTGATGNPAVFACGDISTGPASVVEAIAAGHEAAESVRRYLDGVDLAEGRTLERPESVPSPDRPVEARPRVREKAADPEARRRDFREVLQGLSREEAMEEAKRCLQCGDCCECLQCVAKCEKKAIDHDARPEEVELSVGAVILAPGYELFDAAGAGEYGYGVYPNVVTSMEFERLLSSTGPTQGHIERPSDGRPPRRIAFIQCVGSRDVGCGAEYCSSVCCMYSAKEAVIAREHDPDVSATVFFLDVRAYGKNFDRYVDSAREDYGVRFIRSFVSGVREDPETRNLLITYVEDGEVKEEEFDLVVLAVGVRPPEAARELAEAAGIELDEHGFALTGELEPNQTTRAGVFVAGAFQGPMDIPESVMNGSAAAASAERLLAAGRGRDVRPKEYPPERDVSGEEPRVGVFICRCGINIASVVDVGSVVEFASKLPGVVWAEELLYTCSQDSLKHIKEVIRDEGLNRVVVSSCTIRTHQLLFRETLRECGLNQFYFEMANIRDQCSWVHRTDPAAALEKAKDLVKAAVAKVKTHEALELRPVPVVQKALVIGGGPAGMTAALEIAGMGYDVYLVEQESELGGNLRRIRRTVGGADVGAYLRDLVGRVEAEPRIEVLTGARVEEFSGHAGHFKTTVSVPATLKAVGGSGGPGRRTRTLEHGVVIVATGVRESVPREHLYGEDPRVLTGLEFEERLEEAGGEEAGDGLPDTAVFIQCVGSRNEERRYCSRTCCVETLKNALRLKELKPEARVYVLYRDMRSYGLYERYYRQAREAGVVFVNYDERAKPEVTVEGAAGGAAAAGSGGGAPAGRLKVKVRDRATGFELAVHPDNVILAAAADPAEGAQALGTLLKVPLNDDGFFLETHIKLAPMDFPSNGIYLCGAGHSPKFIAEAVYQARGAAARAATILSRENMMAGGVVASVDERFCAACLTCVRACPFQVPKINERGVAEISPVQCMGCGTCAAECPGKAIQLANYKDVQLAAKVAGMYARVSD
jgi:heterodisulfide reductase subunit A-like polyferredoxin